VKRAGAGGGAIAMLLALLCAAPTAGDIGGCGTGPDEIAPERYAAARKRLECDRCRECGVRTDRCVRACASDRPSDVALPATCRPLVHDAEVCLRALLSASCDTFARAVDDVSPVAPSECLFCREGAPSGDASAEAIDRGDGS
jgi:hypothetical protein